MARKRLEDEVIISAIISEGSVKGAAASLNVSVRTLYERMRKPDFRELYATAKADILKAATAKLQGQLSAAIDTLSSIMKDEDTAKQTRVNSAVSILQYASRYTDQTDIIERIEALEQARDMQTV